MVFEQRDDVKLWLERIHAGYSGGKGRRQWSAEQKTRYTGYTKNLFAQKVLDVGEQRGFISATDRAGRLSTVQRYISNPLFRNALGLDINDPENITTTLPEDDFHVAFERFMDGGAWVFVETLTALVGRKAVIALRRAAWKDQDALAEARQAASHHRDYTPLGHVLLQGGS